MNSSIDVRALIANRSYRIHKLIHWWIGLKACNVILARDRLDRERRKKAENRAARTEAEIAIQTENGTPASFVALAPNSVLHDDTGSRGSPMSSSAMLTPPESGESPVVGPREGPSFNTVNGNGQTTSALHAQHGHPQNVSEGVWRILAAAAANDQKEARPPHAYTYETKAAVQQQIASQEQAAIDRQISVDVAKLVASFRPEGAATENVPEPSRSRPYRGMDQDGLRALRQYIYHEEYGITIDEEALLSRLEVTWREGVRADYDKLTSNIPIFIARERAFLVWIELKRHLAALERADKRELQPEYTVQRYVH